MRRDYYVVPPNTARVGRPRRASLGKARAPGPEGLKLLKVTPN